MNSCCTSRAVKCEACRWLDFTNNKNIFILQTESVFPKHMINLFDSNCIIKSGSLNFYAWNTFADTFILLNDNEFLAKTNFFPKNYLNILFHKFTIIQNYLSLLGIKVKETEENMKLALSKDLLKSKSRYAPNFVIT